MNTIDIANILRETLFVAVKVGAPTLLASLAAGLCISILQAVTQINESTLAFLPKFLASMAALLFSGSFMYETLITYTRHIFDQVIVAGGS
ncbi:flagellar biosynthetic protein FliQ [Acetobacter nitrogenifigens DSM 23921 = NBRC 105050]|uniref:Flagellar export apparatus protein FliQ n=2 Tax=Acetobacter TaxID=434 RepID=A0A511XB41_9PROT|nr:MULTISPECIES: flagellar biosynthetic protein FliQ [Acetobacter]MBO1360493.1 flagellar biosynthetic protein FliQ [Acetobacter sacchari]OUJ14216.1 flagellar biosynthesis protein FliQ [Acetobacter sp. DsW_063]GBQ92994.1 flagellar biosynthetic protein FliQ [Acetobacter nitrogenifigens DSM 23921 = NBRC 105050]GEN60187.1 flagellar export apparatus protein FliQ [Acetobacter nitrogenifigens DSM 23921 = NBRC 105050]